MDCALKAGWPNNINMHDDMCCVQTRIFSIQSVWYWVYRIFVQVYNPRYTLTPTTLRNCPNGTEQIPTTYFTLTFEPKIDRPSSSHRQHRVRNHSFFVNRHTDGHVESRLSSIHVLTTTFGGGIQITINNSVKLKLTTYLYHVETIPPK